MAWPLVAAMVASAAIGASKEKKLREAQERQLKMQKQMEAAKARYSPWTGFSPDTGSMQVATADPAMGALQGAAAGAQFYAANKGLFTGGEAAEAGTGGEGFSFSGGGQSPQGGMSMESPAVLQGQSPLMSGGGMSMEDPSMMQPTYQQQMLARYPWLAAQ